MDERQWWFASKLQDTFRFSGYDNPSLLEDFLSDDEVSESITRFLGSGGPRKLFFYCEAQEGGYNRTPSLNNRQLQVTDHPGRHMLNKTKDNVCLYVLRRGIFGEVDTSQIDREVYCGEIRHSVIVNLALLLSEAFMPLLHAQENWRMCSFDNQITFLQTFDRLTNNIQESATLSLSHEQHLQQPSQTLRESLTAFQSQNPGRIAIDNEVLLECEALVGEWIGCIEGILIEATDERLEDPYSFPTTEIQKVERRHILLRSVVEQLKRRESTTVIAALAAGKSRLIKKWRATDNQLTEAFNACKDKIRYLSTLQQHFEAVQLSKSISAMSENILPSFAQSIRKMDGLSRLYSHTGYMAIILKKFANLVSSKCQELLETETTGVNGHPLSWSNIATSEATHLLMSKLSDIAKLSIAYRDMLYSLKDSLLLQTHLKQRNVAKIGKNAAKNSLTSQVAVRNNSSISSTSIPRIQSGFSLSNVDEILESLFDLADRAIKLSGILGYLKRLHTLQPLVIGLPRSRTNNSEEFQLEVEREEDERDAVAEADEGQIKDSLYDEMSMAELVVGCVDDILDCLSKGCPRGTCQVFPAPGKDKSIFPSVYLEYLQLVETFEETVCKYLKNIFPAVKESKRGLDILDRFKPIAVSKTVQESIHLCYLMVFRRYSIELEHLKEHYEQHKESPPLPRGQAQIAGSIEWARSLLYRVQKPMEVFKQDEALMKTPESHHICGLYNKLSTVLLQYEGVWLKQYKERMERSSSHWMSAPLLRLQDREKEKRTRIVVNSDTGLLQLLGEIRSLLRLGAPLSASARNLLSQETRVKSFQQRLEQVVGDLYEVTNQIDSKLRPLFDRVIEIVLRFFQPGWTTLTWSTLNIDAFLHQVETAVDLLRSAVLQSNEVLSQRVYPVFDRIAETTLVDKETITSREWEPEEFSEVVSDSIETQASEVVHSAAQCKVALLEVVNLVTGLEDQLYKTLEEHSNAMSKSIDYIKVKRELMGTKMEEVSKSVQHSGLSLYQDKVEVVLRRFSVLLNRSVGLMVHRSHSLLFNTITSCEGPGNIEADGEGSGTHIKPSSGLGSNNGGIKIQVNLRFQIPTVLLEPSIPEVYGILNELLALITDLLDQVQPWLGGVSEGDEEVESVIESVVDSIHNNLEQLKKFFEGLNPQVNEFIQKLEPFKKLWEKDLNKTYELFLNTKPTNEQWREEIMEFVGLEEEIISLPESVAIGPLLLLTRPLKSSLKSLASNWKVQFISFLHKGATEALASVIKERDSMFQTLSTPINVGDLPFLREVLELLLHIDDMFHHVDSMYLPVEDMYRVLRSFKLVLPRVEAEQVDSLREKWDQLNQLAANVSHVILTEQRLIHEQETSKAVKEFVMETIQFRNAFDTEGPLVPGLIPTEAVSRVGLFLDQSDQLQKKRNLLDAVQSLLCIPNTPYPELEHTQEELSFLRALYNNYQNFIAFEERFRQTLWSEVDLNTAIDEVNGFWEVFLGLPLEQQNWEASHKLRLGISHYQQTLPLFKKLHSKEIRNRHWLQVMNVADCNFQLDSRIFRMDHLIEADLLRFVIEIERIISDARKELDLEQQFLSIEERWSEQVLKFESHSCTEVFLLSEDFTLSLLEQLDSTQTELAVMLMSKHIHPLRSDCAQWAGKLGHVAEVLQVWLNVQELWLSLQPVFSNEETAKDFPEEAVMFSEMTVSWKGLMEHAESVKSCIQCCIASEEPVLSVLLKLTSNLEHCKKSLSVYLMEKRLSFPRLFYIPDDGLLALLSNPGSVRSVTPYLRSLFGGISNLLIPEDDPLVITSVESAEGEELPLAQTVSLSSKVEEWLSLLHASSRLTIQQLLLQAMDSDLPSLEEIALYHVTQVACVSLYQQWTKDCEVALGSCRYDRRALPGLRAKFNNSVVSRLNTLLMRSHWKHSEEPVTGLQRNRLQNMAVLSLWLRDIIDDLCQRKLREVDDFEWRRFPRLVPHVSVEGDQEMKLHCLDVEVPYCNEYLGCQQLPVFSPRTDSYFISLTQSLQNNCSSCLMLPNGVHKTELVKGISYLVGQFVVTLHCTPLTQSAAIASYLTGLVQDGSWACFCDVHLLLSDGLSLLGAMMDAIYTAIRSKEETVALPHSREVPLKLSSSIFLTHTPTWAPPSFLSPLLRTFSIPPPDAHLTLRTQCMALGLKGAKILIQRLETLMSFINEQLSLSETGPRVSVYSLCWVLSVASRRVHSHHATPLHHPTDQTPSKANAHKITPGRSPYREPKSQTKLPTISQASPQPLPPGVAREHSLIAETIAVLLGARFSQQELPVFYSFIRDTFHDCPEIEQRVRPHPTYHLTSFFQSTASFRPIRTLLEERAEANSLTCYSKWMDKVEQLYLLLKTNHAVVLYGRESTGKTSALKTVVAALNSKEMTDQLMIKLQNIYPGVFLSLSDLFGGYDDSGNWRDGVFTSLLRKSTKATQTSTWICFDGQLSGEWTDHIGQLTATKTISLSNGELLTMNSDTMKLVFETGDISSASPCIVTHSGLIHFDLCDISWRALASSWLKSKKQNETNCLQKVFEAIIDPVIDFVLHKSEYRNSESEVGLFETCLSYLSSLLSIYTETAEVFSEVHVERLFLFSVIWSYGAVLLRDRERRRFSLLLRQLSNSLPDDDTEYSVFDYYVDESGEWDIWQSKLSETRCQGVDLFGEVFVETATTIRIEMLLELALASKRHVLLVGPHSSCKTSTLKHFLSTRALHFSKHECTSSFVLNGQSKSQDIHDYMQVHLQHRQGYAYGPHHNRCLHLLIEDLQVTKDNSNSSLEYLRSVVDDHGVFNLNKKNQWNSIEDVLVFMTMTSSEGATVDPRLKRHFITVPVDSLSNEDLTDIIPIAMSNLTAVGGSVSSDLIAQLSSASVELFLSLKDILVGSDVPGRNHYLFSLQQLSSALQGLGYCSGCNDTSNFAQLWTYEMIRAFGSSICRHGDLSWLTSTVHQTAKKHFGPVECYSVFSSISPNVQHTKETSRATPLSTMPDLVLHLLPKWDSIEGSVDHYLSRYQEEVCADFKLDLDMNSVMIVEKVHRAIRHARGNCVLVGSLDLPLHSLSSLALYIAGYSEQQQLLEEDGLDYRQFIEVLRCVFRLAGLEGSQVALVMEEKHLQDPAVLGLLNSLMSSYELPTLFSNEELEGLFQALAPSIKRDFPSEQIDPAQYFTARICQNLRVVLCVSPQNKLMEEHASLYPGILHKTHVVWVPEWTPSFLTNTTLFFLDNVPLSAYLPSEHKQFISDIVSSIHSYVLVQSGHMVQAGVQPAIDNHPRTSNTGSTSLTPFYYLLEKMVALRDNRPAYSLKMAHVGPSSLDHFMQCLCQLYREKSSEIAEQRASLSQALQTLHSVKELVSEMQSSLETLKKDLSSTSQCSSSLLKELTAKSCKLERLRAISGEGGVVYSAMKMVSEQKRLMSENEEDDNELLAIFYDRLPRKSSRIDALIEKAKSQVEEAEREERDTKVAMMKTKEKAHYWQHRIDRNTIDQIKTLPNPPALVGVIMELMLSLFKRYGSESAQSRTGNEPTSPAVNRRRVSSLSVNSKMEREQWTQLQLEIGDSQRFLDLINGLKWEEGLHKDAIALIESKLATSCNSRSANGVGGSHPSTADSRSSAGGGEAGLITVSMAKHAAESAASMCGFAVAIVEYQYSFEPYHQAHLKAERLRKQLKALENEVPMDLTLHQSSLEHPDLSDVEEEGEESGAGEEELRRVEGELADLQNRFDKSMMKKHSLSSMCQELTTKLKLARNLLEGLKSHEEVWSTKIAGLPSVVSLLVDCVVSAAMLTYSGPLLPEQRSALFNVIKSLCKSEEVSTSLTFDSLPSFLLSEANLHCLTMEDLPLDNHSLFNSCIITSPHTPVWPLILDPWGMVKQWLHKRRGPKETTFVKFEDHTLSTVLIQCLTEGKPLVVTDIDTASLCHNETLFELMQSKVALSRGKSSLKFKIDGTEVECDRSFRLFLVTDDPLTAIPPQMGPLCSVVLFHPQMIGLETLLLNEFLYIHNHKTFCERSQLKQDIYDHVLQIDSLEKQLLKELHIAKGEELELDSKVINKLLSISTSYDFVNENLVQASQSLQEMTHYSLSTLITLSRRASVIMNCVLSMVRVCPVYRTNYSYALEVFNIFVTQTGSRIQSEDTLSKLTKYGINHFEKGYLEADRQLFLVLTAIQIEISEGNMSLEEQDFLLTPSPGTKFSVKGLIVNNQDIPVITLTNAVFGKKPFDWMSEKQWQMLLMLASHFEWIHPFLMSMGRDGKETVWRSLSEGAAPETLSLIDAIGQKLLLTQQLLIQCAFRPERLSQFALVFASKVLDQKPLMPKLFEFQGVIRSVLPGHTPLIIYNRNPALPLFKLQNYAKKNQVNLSAIKIFGCENSEDISTVLERVESLKSKEKEWVLLHDIHLSEPIMEGVIHIMEKNLQDKEHGRLWLSVNADSLKTIPQQLLQRCLRVAIEAPDSPLSSLTHTLFFSGLLSIINQSSRSEWLPLIHSLAMFHLILRNRRHTCSWAVGGDYNWNHTHLTDALMYASKEFTSSEVAVPGIGGVRPISWSGIRFMCTEVIYGSLVTCSADMLLLNAMADHWLHPGGPKKETGRYHIPSIFFTPNTRLANLIQAIETVAPPLVPTSELCGLHFTAEMELGYTKYLLKWLEAITVDLKRSITSEMRQPITVVKRFDSTLSVNTQKAVQTLSAPRPLDRLPAMIQFSYNLIDLFLDSVKPKELSIAIEDAVIAQQIKATLLSTVNKLLESIPTGWKTEVLMERLSRHRLESPFTQFLLNETQSLNKCLARITTDLQDLQTALQSSVNTHHSSLVNLSQTALSLILLRVPDSWSECVGPSAPPSSLWGLQEWLNDIAQRYVFMDKVLVWGIERTPTYWLGAFFNPQRLLSTVLQQSSDTVAEQGCFIADLTSRDKDHIRDPPQEGMFLYGMYLWGTHFEKSTSLDLSDTPPRSVCPSGLPIVHLTIRDPSFLPLNNTTSETKPPFTYYAPCYFSRNQCHQTPPLFYVKTISNDVNATKWSLRNMFCTLRPF